MLRALPVPLLALVLSPCGVPQAAHGAEFTATYTPLASSPQGGQSSWNSGGVTNDGKLIYGIGDSHNAYGTNSLWTYDPVTNTHKSLFPNTGNKWLKNPDGTWAGKWATLDPVADKSLYTFFGGLTITALPNRNNHQAFYVPARNEFWVLAGTTMYQANPYFAGRFSLDTNRWVNLSKTLGEFSNGVIENASGWVSPNAATPVCKDINTAVMFGGMNGTGGVRIIEPNTGPEPYRMVTTTKSPIYQPAENMRHNAACVGDTIYYVGGMERVSGTPCCRTPNPVPFWKFHVPTRTWTKLPAAPMTGYFPTLTYDSDVNALLLYGGGDGGHGSKALWVYDLSVGTWQDLTDTTAVPQMDKHIAGFIPGVGHVIKGGRKWDAANSRMYSAAAVLFKVKLTRMGAVTLPPPVIAQPAPTPTPQPAPPVVVPPPVVVVPPPVVVQPPVVVPPPVVTPPPAPTPAPVPVPVPVLTVDVLLGRMQMAIATAQQLVTGTQYQQAVGAIATAFSPLATILDNLTAPVPVPPPVPAPTPAPEPTPAPTPTPVPAPAPLPVSARFEWTKIPLVCRNGANPCGSIKHQRMAEGPNGRLWVLGGDMGGLGGGNGQQEVFSFDPNSADGAWRAEAPDCGTQESPTHWHTDESGVFWDAKRSVFWKMAGTHYGADDACFLAGGSIKLNNIQFNPAKKQWVKPVNFDQTNVGYLSNGVIDPQTDQAILISDKAAHHYNLGTGVRTAYPLPTGAMRFNAQTARIGRNVWWLNRDDILESYNIDTHKLTAYGVWPFPPHEGWGVAMTFAHGENPLLIWPTSLSTQAREAAIFNVATKQWTKVDMAVDMAGARGNGGVQLADGRIVLWGGMAPPEDHNKFVWVGMLQ